MSWKLLTLCSCLQAQNAQTGNFKPSCLRNSPEVNLYCVETNGNLQGKCHNLLLSLISSHIPTSPGSIVAILHQSTRCPQTFLLASQILPLPACTAISAMTSFTSPGLSAHLPTCTSFNSLVTLHLYGFPSPLSIHNFVMCQLRSQVPAVPVPTCLIPTVLSATSYLHLPAYFSVSHHLQ